MHRSKPNYFLRKPIRSISRTALCCWGFILFQMPVASAQQLTDILHKAWVDFMGLESMKYGIAGFYLADDKGNTVFSKYGNTGLAPASCLKTATAAAALTILGADFRFRTTVSASGAVEGGTLQGDLLLEGSGDPTLGSWRYPSQPDTAFFFNVYEALAKRGIHTVSGDLVASNRQFSVQAIPGGWIYDDMGNYYGAGSWALNYRENQYDAVFSASGQNGDTLPLMKTVPEQTGMRIKSQIRLGAAGSGDQSVLYAAPYQSQVYGTGTLGKTNRPFSVSGSVDNGERYLMDALKTYLSRNGITILGRSRPSFEFTDTEQPAPKAAFTLTEYKSVPLDSVVYWFLQKSINLYGEALLKAMAIQSGKPGDTQSGVDLMRDFWEQRGIDKNAFRIQDGSGLSPQNKVTAKSLVQVLQFAAKQPWFSAYYEGLPLIHNIKMKSGTIGGTKGYAGFIRDKKGTSYCFAFLVNNFSGTSTAINQKMWDFLDVISRFPAGER